MRAFSSLSLSLLFTACYAGSLFAEINFHVAPTGSDTNPGSDTEPFATVHQARETIRAMKSLPDWNAEPINVLIHAGHYHLASPLELTEQDSGTEQAPIRFRAIEGDEVTLCGGWELDVNDLIDNNELINQAPKVARPFLKVYSLNGRNPAAASLNRRALGIEMMPAPIELFSGDTAMPRAGWPNSGWANVPDSHNKTSWTIDRSFDNLSSDKPWAHGFWKSNWEDSLESIDLNNVPNAENKTQLTLKHDLIEVHPGARFRIVNLLSELDSPGEWFFDHQSNRLIVWPNDESIDRIVASYLETAVSIYDASFVSFEGLTVEGTRAMGIEVVGGNDVSIQNCTIRYVGNVGLNVYHGSHHTVSQCHVHGTGSSGIRIEGGERTSLVAANHVCEENEVHHCSYSYTAQRPAIAVYGVGITIRNNHIHTHPDSAIVLNGNDHLVEANHIHDVCQLTDDTGAIYIGHNPTFRGNRIVKNYIHDLGGFSDRDVVGIYLDDFVSGTNVEGNVLHRTVRGIAIGGGRDNTINNNVVVDCLAGIQVDNRGCSWANHHFEGATPVFHQHCNDIAHDQAPYVDRYPALKDLLDDEPHVAKGNVISRNVIECPIKIDLQDGLKIDIVKVEGNRRGAKNEFANIDWTDTKSVMAMVKEKSTSQSELASK